MNGRTNGRTDGRTDGWTDGRTDGRTDERTQQRGFRNRSLCMRTPLQYQFISCIFQWISLQPAISISQPRPPGLDGVEIQTDPFQSRAEL